MTTYELNIYSLLCMGLGGVAVITGSLLWSLARAWLHARRRRTQRHLNRIVRRA